MNGSIIIHVDNLESIYIIKMYIYIYIYHIYIQLQLYIYIYVHYVYQVDHPSNVTILPFATSNLSLSWIAGTFPTILNNTYSTKEPCKFHAICIDLLVSANSFQRLILCSTKIRWSHNKTLVGLWICCLRARSSTGVWVVFRGLVRGTNAQAILLGPT